uniref:DUF4283 domain-containing protein n=1 Tax=Cannabis sativa TaxID=3483 RepID=A0A803PMN7_CANSA
MDLFDRFLGNTNSRSKEKPTPPALNKEATPKAPNTEYLSASVIDLIEPVLNVEPLQQVPMGSSEQDSSDYDGPVNAEFADYDKWDEPYPGLINRAKMTKRFHPRVGTDVAPFLADLLDQSTTMSCKLGAHKFAMMASGDSAYMADAMRTKRKKGVSKPSSKGNPVLRESPELPSIQEDDAATKSEVFLDTCEELKPAWKEEISVPAIQTPSARSWADEAEAHDFQESAKIAWSKFKVNQVRTPSSQLNFTEPLEIGDQGNLGVKRIVRMHSGFTLVSFKDEVTRDIILETGVIQFDKKPVVLRPWTVDMDATQMIRSVPVWIRLNGLGLQYWGKKNLSALISTIGKPITADKVALERSMIKFARVLVDVEIKDDPPRTIAFVNEKGQLNMAAKEMPLDKNGNASADMAVKVSAVSSGAKENQVIQSSKESQAIQSSKEGNDNWITPKRKGAKLVNNDQREAKTSNGFEALKEADGDKRVKVNVLFEDKQLVHCKIKMVGFKEEFFLIAVYGKNQMSERKDLCDKLEGIGHLNEPWIILGNFNAMFSYKDRCGGRKIKDIEIQDSRNWLAQGQVEELKSSGSFFTWSNKHEEGSLVYSKLDRVFANENWVDAFPNVEASFRWGAISDHSYCLVKHITISNKGLKPFRFCNYWTSKVDYKVNVLNTWRKRSTTDLKSLYHQLLRIKHVLKNYYISKNEDPSKSYKDAKEAYRKAQELAANDPLSDAAAEGERKLYEAFLET